MLLQNSTRIEDKIPIESEVDGAIQSVLLLQDIGALDNVTYKCEATNRYGTSAKNISVNVIPTARVVKPEEYQRNSTFEFDCFPEVIFGV